MDLIYADALRQDIGVMTAYTLDMAYGSGENASQMAAAVS